MSEINKINIKLSSPEEEKKISCEKPITLQDVIEWIKKQEYDVKTEKELIKLLKKYPSSAFNYFIKNIKNYVVKVRKLNND